MKNKTIFQLITLIFLVCSSSINGQDLLDKLNKEFPDKPIFEIATFKTTRIALGHSIETRKKGALEISFYNRYWNIPNFQGQRFLADKISTRFGLEYAFSDNFTVGFGYTNFDKISDSYIKHRLIRQQKGAKKTPISITIFQGMSHRTSTNNALYGGNSSDKYAFTSQLLIARKFNSNFSLQIAPTFIHRAANNLNNNPNNQFSIGFSGRYKIGGHASFVSEYYHVTNPLKSINTFNTFTVGVNWELSYLQLQFHVTNARNFAEDTFITQTTNNFNFNDPNFHFGFNATFVLHTRKNKLK
ncbi:DUF5777 family beta-barrel protein [Polaribacter uvawellassae]|uniref:DUF5777 family beta-barrel protein n=1 Tax=Polaribacter uvawellassae TaxID=3133495 RepID=UPI00321BC2A7